MEPSSHQPTAVGTALVHVSNAFFELLDYDGDTSILADAYTPNGLVALGSSGGIILTGQTDGAPDLRRYGHRPARRGVDVDVHEPPHSGRLLAAFAEERQPVDDARVAEPLQPDPGGHHHVPVDVVVRPPGGQRPQHREVVPAQDSRIAARVHARSVPQRGLH